MSAEIVTPKEFRMFARKLKDVWNVEMPSVAELVELANTLGVKVIFKLGKEYVFLHDWLVYYAKE